MRQVLLVSPDGSMWKVHWKNGTKKIQKSTKEEAIKYAKALVGKFAPGVCSQILIQKGDGTFQTEWTYGKDPFPPRG